MPPSLPLQSSLRASASASKPSSISTLLSKTLLSSRITRRALTTTPLLQYKQPPVPGSDLPIPSARAPCPEIPPYPYGPRPFYHQSNTGLYGSAAIRFGNNVSEKHNVKTRRNWRPNVHHKRLWSESLNVFVSTRVTARVLRTIDKAGGLDEYLLKSKPARVKDLGPWGWRLRWRIMQTPAVRERFAREREALGLPPKEEEEEEGVMATLPDGSTVSGEALMAETDRMLSDEAVFELGGREAEAEAEDKGDQFMREEKPVKE
jgi:large subunit ribosomal protein L28